MEDALSIGELARRTSIDPRTIRYYEKAGILPTPRRLENGYRAYSPEDVDRLRFVAGARRLDFSLAEIAEILALRDRGEAPCDRVLQAMEEKAREVALRIRQLRALETHLAELRAAARELPVRRPEEGPCICRLVEGVPGRSSIRLHTTGGGFMERSAPDAGQDAQRPGTERIRR
ncbi:MerR family transcriptional regulator [Limnochorda pilosa]|uniref:MerR family transcriptional regulator n=1 Tax=Limnochorda pilosa TaxID=1555112 RepID=A0A0K2SPY6_LIMPI|nr:MerR family transcriptional regulator [Limnochorda pilosa]BAS29178.1 MerR family transcriptional regulator [Limnochorda pilosa]